MSVAASDSSDQIAYFSNYGTCVDIIAPVSCSILIHTTNDIFYKRVLVSHQLGGMEVQILSAVSYQCYI